MIDQELVEILCCPETKVPVRLMTEDEVAALNRAIGAGGVVTTGGRTVESPIEAGLITEDGNRVYRIEDDIPIMLIDEGIAGDHLT